MSTVRVYRPQRDWKNQRPKDLEDSYIGDVTGVIVGAPAVRPLGRFPGNVSTEGQMGFPWEQDSGIVVQTQDILVLRGEKYLVTGPRTFEDEHVYFGGEDAPVDDYYWVEVTATN